MTAPKEKYSLSHIDRHLAIKLKAVRLANSATQADLGNILGTSYQQIQKYERGENRLAASHLYKMAYYYKIPVQWFFSDLPATDKVSLYTANDAADLKDILNLYLQLKSTDAQALARQLAQSLAQKS